MEVSAGGIGGMLFCGESCLPSLDALVKADDLVNMLPNSKASRAEVLLSVLDSPASIPFGGLEFDLVKRVRKEARHATIMAVRASELSVHISKNS